MGLRGWHWSPATAHALAAAGPAHLTFEVQMLEPLTDELLGVALAMGPHVRGVWAQTLALRSEQHAGMVGGWWAQLGLGVLDLASFVKLPRPQQDCPIQLSAECVIVTGAVHTVSHTSTTPFWSCCALGLSVTAAMLLCARTRPYRWGRHLEACLCCALVASLLGTVS